MGRNSRQAGEAVAAGGGGARTFGAEASRVGWGRRAGPPCMNDEVLAIEAVDIAEILKTLPHRYPFLMVDRIVELRADESAIGIKNVTVNEPQFLGHFHNNTVF